MILLKNMLVKMGTYLPQFSGWTFQKYLKRNHLGFFCCKKQHSTSGKLVVRDCYLGPIRIPNHRDPNHQFTTSWNKGCIEKYERIQKTSRTPHFCWTSKGTSNIKWLKQKKWRSYFRCWSVFFDQYLVFMDSQSYQTSLGSSSIPPATSHITL